jgi:hypothetical protein
MHNLFPYGQSQSKRLIVKIILNLEATLQLINKDPTTEYTMYKP